MTGFLAISGIAALLVLFFLPTMLVAEKNISHEKTIVVINMMILAFFWSYWILATSWGLLLLWAIYARFIHSGAGDYCGTASKENTSTNSNQRDVVGIRP